MEERFAAINEPCVRVLAGKISDRLRQSMDQFRGVPAAFRMTGKSVSGAPSEFVEGIYAPVRAVL